ncbi:DHA2 family efflux MFS transporter permease subunit [Streptomyces sp. MJP52]|uniref:DHA2 family efflux MFS transporter permease subunit n=2 Tax=Streptomyces TaxID=1883 RepID=UPI002474EBC7|nr:DHA2 family efflux MFS transporter permease subunit [Streptomyces sp. MJP52]MDH6227791.1 EmrB/QacA subfamily drug resistance transporter [Streptomyces sp. MJP52]
MPVRSLRLDQRIVVPVVCVVTAFMSIVDGVGTTVALPSIGRDFGLATAGLDAVVVVYPVCVGLAVPVSAWLGDRFGGRRTVLVSFAVFTAASGLCGVAGSLGELVLWRALQGLAAGILLPVSGALLYRTFSLSEQVKVSRYMIIPQQVAPALAPMGAGWLVDHMNWRWVFYANVPIGVAVLLFGLLFLEQHRDHVPGRLDVPGLVLTAFGTAGLMFGVSEGAEMGWGSAPVLAGLVGGAVLLAAAVAVELRVPEPALRFRLFGDRLFRDTNITAFLGFLAFMGAMFLGPLFLQQGLGLSAWESGSSTFAEALGVLLTMQVVTPLYARIGPRRLAGFGLIGVALVLVAFSRLDADSSLWTFRGLMFLLGAAMGGVFMPTTVASFTGIGQADVSHASTLNTVVRQASGAAAPAVAIAVLASAAPVGTGVDAHPPVSAFQDAYLVLAVVSALAAVFAFTMPDRAARLAATARAAALRKPVDA